MRKVKFLSIFVLLALLSGAGFAISLLSGRSQAAEAAELVEGAITGMVIPQPGQVAHYTYEVYRRPPPADLEPADPYHLPYAEIWPEWQVEHTWLEISSDGRTTRWRTQLSSVSGDLLQDLVFDGQTEIDYFPASGRAEVVPGTTVGTFTDDRVALFRHFLSDGGLSRRASLALDGTQVTSVYAAPGRLTESGDVAAGLLGFQSPFLADLQPVSIGLRIDFDPVTLAAVGEAQIVYEGLGQEHIVSYRMLSDPEILAPNDPRLDGLFELDLPAGVVVGDDHGPLPLSKVLTDLDQIAASVTFPIYGLPDGEQGFQLASVDYTVPAAEIRVPREFLAIYFASSVGAGVRTVYIISDSNPTAIAPAATITLIQGTPDRLSQSLRATRPMWLSAQPADFTLADQHFPGWVLTAGENNQLLRYVIETPQSLIFLEAVGLTTDQFQSLLRQMIQVQVVKE